MGRRKIYRDPPLFAKQPKDHEKVVASEGTYYLRMASARRKRVLDDTPSRKKMRNLLLLQLEYRRSNGEPNAEEFRNKRNIGIANYRRLIALVKDAFGEGDGSGNTVPDTPSSRKYKLVLAMNMELTDGGVDRDSFCARFKIGRSSFFRYLADIEDFIAKEGEAIALCIDADSGKYRIFPPYVI